MKKLLLLLLLVGMSSAVSSQCMIQGANEVKVGEQAVYQVPSEFAQCADCHQWKVSGFANLNGDLRKNEIRVTANQPGAVMLSLTMLTPNGVEQCTKSINFVGEAVEINRYQSPQNTQSYQNSQNNQNYYSNYYNPKTPKVDCDIDIRTFKEVKYEDNSVAFFPTIRDNNYSYKWEAFYVNGIQPRVSEEKVSTFDNNLPNYIEKVALTVTSKRCIKKLSKTYNESYWMFLNSNK